MTPIVSTVQPSYSDEQIAIWLKGLLSIAWADGHFDPEEQELIVELTHTEITPLKDSEGFQPVDRQQLVTLLGENTRIAENFLRTAVMVSIVDGVYSSAEDELLHEFCTELGLDNKILESLRLTLNCQLPGADLNHPHGAEHHLEPLKPLQEWLDHLEVHDPRLAHFLCKLIPPQCPFERDITLFGHKVVHIPPMCKLNPLYEQLVGLRFRALSYLADECQEDVSKYC
jgi:tellurite resistance protein